MLRLRYPKTMRARSSCDTSTMIERLLSGILRRRPRCMGIVEAMISNVVIALVGLALSVTPGFGQAKDQSREICQPHGGRCQTIKPPNLPPAPANWEMPRTHDGKPDFTGVYAGAGFNHQIGKNDTDTAIFRGFD